MARAVITDYAQVIKSIRELALDLNPVSCFTISKQDFLIRVDSDGILIKNNLGLYGSSISYSIYSKMYEIVKAFKSNNFNVLLTLNYMPLESVVLFAETPDYVSVNNTYSMQTVNYFSQDTIESCIIDFLLRFYGQFFDFDGNSESISTLVLNNLPYHEIQRMIVWVAYWLVDKKRANMAANESLRELNEESFVSSDELINFLPEVSTRVGDTFTVTERSDEIGEGTADFTALWGDKFKFLTKHQLYLRNLLEGRFDDFSLRENRIIVGNLTIEKHYSDFSYVNTHSLSPVTKDIFLPID